MAESAPRIEPYPASAHSGWYARLRRRFRPPRGLRLTRIGRTYVVVTLGIGLGALNTGNNLLYLTFASLLSAIVASGILSERTLKRLRVERIGADAAHAQEPFSFRWRVRQEGSAAAFAFIVREKGAALEGEARVGVLRAGEERIVTAKLRAGRRGPQPLEEVEVVTVWPLGLFAKSITFPSPGTLLVFPRRAAARGELPPGEQPRDSLGGQGRRGGGHGDLRALRPLREGEDARRVHWRQSAARGKLITVDRDREEQPVHVLEVDPSLPPDALDRRCEEVAALAAQLLDRGDDVGLRAGDELIPPASGPLHRRRLLTALAWVGFDERSRHPGARRRTA